MDYTTSQTGINLIKSFEGCRLTSYRDVAGIWTIGYGHTGNIAPGMCISQEQAEAFLKSDLARFEECVNRGVTVPLTQDMFDALVSFTYNVGTGALQRSTLLCKLNRAIRRARQKNLTNGSTPAKKSFPDWSAGAGKKKNCF